MSVTSPPLGRRVAGPTALGDDPRRFWTLTWLMASTEFRLKFFGSVFGYLWQVMRPLLQFAILFVLFTEVVPLGAGSDLYATALLLAVVLYTFFSEATAGALPSLVNRENLMRKVDFPRLAVPAASVVTALLNLGISLSVVFIFLIAQGGDPRLDWLQLPLILGALTFLSAGIAMVLAPLYVSFRDIQPIWEVTLLMLFYASAIFTPVETILVPNADLIRQLMMMNPLAALIQQARHALIGGSHPSAATAIGGWEWLLIPGGITVGIFVLGALMFRRAAPKVAEHL